jgi:hypothetical protein
LPTWWIGEAPDSSPSPRKKVKVGADDTTRGVRSENPDGDVRQWGLKPHRRHDLGDLVTRAISLARNEAPHFLMRYNQRAGFIVGRPAGCSQGD